MSKDTFIKATAQGGGPGGGGPPGTWTEVSSGSSSIGNNQSVDVATVGFPTGAGVYMAIATQDDSGGAAQVVQGDVLSAPPTTTVFYSLITWAGGVILRLRGGSAIGSTTINWALYQVVP